MKNYFIILTFLLLPFMTAQAQNGGIIYTCFYPDTCKVVHYPDSMAFDVDYDGVLDFWFNGGVEIGALIPRIVVNDGWEFCIVKDSVELTNDTLLWCDNDSYSQWWNAYNMRYGFRKTIEGKYYYAWTEATVDYYETPWNQTKLFCESGMAFCTIPDYPLRWGQTNFIGIEETEANVIPTLPMEWSPLKATTYIKPKWSTCSANRFLTCRARAMNSKSTWLHCPQVSTSSPSLTRKDVGACGRW